MSFTGATQRAFLPISAPLTSALAETRDSRGVTRPSASPLGRRASRRRGGSSRGGFVRLVAFAAAFVALLIPSVTASAAGAAGDTGAVEARWAWPVEPAILQRGYEAPASRYASGHRGIDLAAENSTPVVAPDDGVVRFAGWVVDRPVISIDHGGGIVSSFEPVTPEVVEGQRVARGQRIGLVASGEHCAGAGPPASTACLHVGARLDGEYFSPLVMFGGIPRAVLLPVE